MKTLLKEIPPAEFSRGGKEAAEILRRSPLWRSYASIFLFLSMTSEIDTHPALQTAIEDGKKVFAPRIEAGRLAFYRIRSACGPWQKGPFGIREPSGETPADGEDFPALIITPGLAFSREGARLGKGKGFYDRFFAELDAQGRRYAALGFCMDFQLVKTVPAGETDKNLDWLMAGNELLAVNV